MTTSRLLQSESELERYLKNKDKELSMFDKYPSVKNFGIKTNYIIT